MFKKYFLLFILAVLLPTVAESALVDLRTVQNPAGISFDASQVTRIYAEDYERIKDAIQDGTAGINTEFLQINGTTCLDVESDQIYHDTDCDGTKDAGEEFIDSTGGSSLSFGSENQIPTTNATTDDFDYSSDLTFDGSILNAPVLEVDDTLNIPNGTTLPASCEEGDFRKKNDEPDGQQLFSCNASNTWVLQGDGNGGGGSSNQPQIVNIPASALELNANGENFPAPQLDSQTNKNTSVLNFSEVETQCARGVYAISSEVGTSGNVEIWPIVKAATAAASPNNTVRWDYYITSLGDSEDDDQAYTLIASLSQDLDATQDNIDINSFIYAVTNHSANDLVQYKICRDHDHADDDLASGALLLLLKKEIP